MSSRKHFNTGAGKILVRDNNIDQALRALKKKMGREGVFRQLKLGEFYEKPSDKRKREAGESTRRYRKAEIKKQASNHNMSVTEYKAYRKGHSPR